MKNDGNDTKKFLCTAYNVLLAVENDEARKATGELLFGYGISVDEADNTELALKLANEHKFDMIFVDDTVGGIEEQALADGLSADCEILPVPRGGEELYELLSEKVPKECKRYVIDGEKEGELSPVKVVRLFMLGVDVLEGIRKNGKMDDYVDLLDLFHMDGMQRMSSLADKVDNEDFKNYIIEVHGLKSAAANIGAAKLSEMAKQHETSGNESDFDYIRENREELFEVYKKVLLEIERVLQALKYGRFAREEAESLGEMERQEVLEHLKQILHSLETFHSKDAAKGVEELLKYSVGDSVKASLEEVSNLLRMYEDDKAEEKLHEMIGQF